MDISPFLAQGSSHHLKENTTLCIKGKFSCFCCRLLTFSKINFQKNYFRTLLECQTVWIQIRTKEILSWSRPKLLHWISEQTTKVAASINYEETSRIIHQAQVYFSPENHVCCISSNEFETTFNHGSKHYESRSDCSLGSYLIWIHIFLPLRLNPCGGHQTDL